jgi:hypothetical protein
MTPSEYILSVTFKLLESDHHVVSTLGSHAVLLCGLQNPIGTISIPACPDHAGMDHL